MSAEKTRLGNADEGRIMAQTDYIVEGRHFRTKTDYTRALHDKEIIDRLRQETNLKNKQQLEKLKKDLKSGKYKFFTQLGQDFQDEIDERLENISNRKTGNNKNKNNSQDAVESKSRINNQNTVDSKNRINNQNTVDSKNRINNQNPIDTKNKVNTPKNNKNLDDYLQEEIKRQERVRKLAIAICSFVAVGCLGYFGVYFYFNGRTDANYEALSRIRDKAVASAATATPAPTAQFTLDGEPEPKEVLEEFKDLLNINKRLIGWVKIDDTNIDFPVVQTVDNEYYLTHNLYQEYDKNGTIFMDADCDVLKPSTNLILYGHHMLSGKMFGQLDRYEKESYWEEHQYIQFDTIYEKGTWQVMYVFRSRVYSQEEIVFKYYQFIDANGEQEFNSNMQEMAALSLYDTGVTAEYGDRLLTLSTCDYEEKNGRFVVVAKKVATKE